MKTYIKSAVTGALGAAAWLVISTSSGQTQDRPARGNFDPQQMRQRMLERTRDQFEVKDDAEWKAIAERIDKVMQARRDAGGLGGPGAMGFPGGPGGRGGPGGFEGPGGPGGPDGPGGPGGPPPGDGDDGPDGFGPPDGPPGAPDQGPGGPPGGPGEMRNGPGAPGGMGGFSREASPELAALRKAIDEKASSADIKA